MTGGIASGPSRAMAATLAAPQASNARFQLNILFIGINMLFN
jgi:hypothetical protein